jgi:DNA-binding NtrC family response regulator
MATRLLILREAEPADGWGEIAGDDLDCTFCTPSSKSFDALIRCRADIVVIAALADSPVLRNLFSWLSHHTLAVPTIAVLAADASSALLQAAADSTDEFVLWPVQRAEWRQRLQRLRTAFGSPQTTPRERLREEMTRANLIGASPGFLDVVSRIPLVARSDTPVLITGETGTGKELCARAVHHLSPRGRAPFVPVDCGALPDHLFENEVFGHSRGAYTDAGADQKGLIAMADGGTLFLDEVDALPLTAQSKLLRFLQERTYKPLGGERFHHADVNVVAATNNDLEALIRTHRFRSDLYFRLNVLSLNLTPLRTRREDIPLLVRHFVDGATRERRVRPKSVAPAALRKLTAHDWPGNIRELHNVVQRAVVFSEGDTILPVHVILKTGRGEAAEEIRASFRSARAHALETFERGYVEELLRRHNGNITRAARDAQKDRRAFGRLVKKYGLHTAR